MIELWRPVFNCPKYYVSTKGRVWSERGNKQRLIKGSHDKDGYIRVALVNKDGSRVDFRRARLVAETFIPNPLSLPVVNHIDENKENDNVENLEWCTAEYNNKYSDIWKNHRRRVMGISITGKTILFDSIKEAGEYLGINKSVIGHSLVRGHLAGGYHWKYA